MKENPDIVPLSAVLQCKMDIEQDRKEETYIKKMAKRSAMIRRFISMNISTG